MSDYLNVSISNNNLCPTMSFVLASELSPDSTTLSGSSKASSLNSLFNEQDQGSTSSVQETWTHMEKTSTPKKMLSTARVRAFVVESVNSVNLNYSFKITDDVLVQADICYGGRDLLDLASNIVPYSWQRKTPLLNTTNIITKIINYSEEETHEEYTMKYCTTCGFSQPGPPA